MHGTACIPLPPFVECNRIVLALPITLQETHKTDIGGSGGGRMEGSFSDTLHYILGNHVGNSTAVVDHV